MLHCFCWLQFAKHSWFPSMAGRWPQHCWRKSVALLEEAESWEGFRESLQCLDVNKPSWRAAGGTEQQRLWDLRVGFSCRVETRYRGKIQDSGSHRGQVQRDAWMNMNGAMINEARNVHSGEWGWRSCSEKGSWLGKEVLIRDLAVAEAKLRLDAKNLYRCYLPVLKY